MRKITANAPPMQSMTMAVTVVLDADDLVVVVHAEIAGPRRLAHGRSVVQRRFNADHPLRTIGDRTDAHEETHRAGQNRNHPGQLGLPYRAIPRARRS